MKLREGAEEATMPTKGQPKEATTSKDNSGMTEAHSKAASNLASWLQPRQWSGLKFSTLTHSDGNRNAGRDHTAELCYCFALYATLVKLQLKDLEYRSNELVAL